MPPALFEALVGITIFTLVLCVLGVGILILPFVALLWVLYFASHLTLGAGIAIGGVAIAIAVLFALAGRSRGK